MPKCGQPKKDGTPCGANAMVGKDHCHQHSRESTPQIEVMTDPVADTIARIQALHREENDLMARLISLRDERDEIVEETSDQLVRERHGLTEEDLAKVQAAARLDFARRAGVQQQKLDEFNRSLREEHRLSYTPTSTDMIPFGGINWHFAAGKEWRYPKCVIEQFEKKRFNLDERDRAKAQLSIDPDEGGREFRQHEALLNANR